MCGRRLALVHRTGGADDEDRRPVDVGVVDRHRGVEEADEVMQDDGAGSSARLGEAVRHLDRDFLVLAQKHAAAGCGRS